MSLSRTEARAVAARAEPFRRIAVIGSGSWGTALATVARRAGREVVIWGRDEETVAAIRDRHVNPKYLPDVALPEGIEATTDLDLALGRADAVLVVTPSKTLREVCGRMRAHLAPRTPVALCAKGIEAKTGLLLGEVAASELPGHPIGALSGPTFARETVLAHPTAATIAFDFSYRDRLDPHLSPATRLAVSMSSESFRPYISDDLVGVEIGGAVKNVIAIACGMMSGAGFAENTRAALITRGMDEMKTLAENLGGRRETVTGLSGAGDLTLTCSSTTSRNMSLGTQLGRGLTRAECFDGKDVVVEGEVNSVSVIDLADKIGVTLPICQSVYDVLQKGASIDSTFRDLWSRPIEAEPKGMGYLFEHPFGETA